MQTPIVDTAADATANPAGDPYMQTPNNQGQTFSSNGTSSTGHAGNGTHVHTQTAERVTGVWEIVDAYRHPHDASAGAGAGAGAGASHAASNGVHGASAPHAAGVHPGDVDADSDAQAEPLVLEASGREVVVRDAHGVQGPVRHDQFTVTRVLAGTPAQVFAHFAEPDRWRRWFQLPGDDAIYHHDFRVGGGEYASSRFAMPSMDPTSDAMRIEELAYRSQILLIVPQRRIVSVYMATIDNIPRWTSQLTLELEPERVGSGADTARTQLRWTEQVALLTPSDDGGDGSDDLAHLRGGVALQLNALAAALAQAQDDRL